MDVDVVGARALLDRLDDSLRRLHTARLLQRTREERDDDVAGFPLWRLVNVCGVDAADAFHVRKRPADLALGRVERDQGLGGSGGSAFRHLIAAEHCRSQGRGSGRNGRRCEPRQAQQAQQAS